MGITYICINKGIIYLLYGQCEQHRSQLCKNVVQVQHSAAYRLENKTTNYKIG